MIFRVLAAEALEECLSWRHGAVAVGLAIAHLLLAVVSGSASMGDHARGVLAVGLWMTTLATLVGAGRFGLVAVGGALASGTAELALVRPLPRQTWVQGRAAGVAAAVAAWTTVVMLSWMPTVASQTEVGGALVLVWVSLCAEGLLVAAWALLLGVVARTEVSLAGLGALLFAGIFADEVLLYASEAGGISAVLARALYVFLPDLDLFDAHALLASSEALPIDAVTWALLYSVTTSGALTLLAGEALARRDLRSAS